MRRTAIKKNFSLFTAFLLGVCQLKMHEAYKSPSPTISLYTNFIYTENFFDDEVESFFLGKNILSFAY